MYFKSDLHSCIHNDQCQKEVWPVFYMSELFKWDSLLFVIIAVHICHKSCLFLLKCTWVPIVVPKKVSKSRWLIDYWALISDSLCTSSAQVNMQEPWKIFSFDLYSLNSCCFMDEIFYRNVIACFFATNAREILVYLLLLYKMKKPWCFNFKWKLQL